MAHHMYENDSMLSVGATPWHKLGTTLKEPPKSGLEALELSKTNWTVSRKPMFLEDGRKVLVNAPDAGDAPKQWASIVRDDTNEILGVVGPNFREYQNHQMAALFDPMIQDKSLTIETCGSLFNGRRVWMLGKLAGPDLLIDTNDVVARYLMLAHGHDGNFAVRFGYTPIRVVCYNTMSMAVSDDRSQLMRCLHTASLDDNLKLLRDAFCKADAMFELTADQFRNLAKRGVNRTDLREYARLVVKADVDQTKWTTHERKTIGEIVGMALEGKGNHGRNWWHAYNGVTEWTSWSKGRKQANRLDSVWFGDSAAINQQALSLALEMSQSA
jgi:phage/plasmid-like protein (TIGR03299 family)